MRSVTVWLYVIMAVAIAVLANAISTQWAKPENRLSLWLVALLVISPLVFLSFGFVTSKVGLSISSAVIDSLLTVTSIAVGLFLFREWQKVSMVQYIGMAMAVCGVALMVYFHAPE